MILIDTSILVDYYRKTDKSNSALFSLLKNGNLFAASVVSKYEIYMGATPAQLTFWDSVFQAITILPFDENCVDTAIKINARLKQKNKQIAIADLFIAATALAHDLPIATLNKKHFERVSELTIIE